MPFTATTRFYPAAGKAVEMQPHAEERTKALQAAGLDAQLAIVRWGPDYPCFLISQRYDTLADYEQAMPAVADVTRQFLPRMLPLSGQQAIPSLQERLQLTNPGGPTKWQQANTIAPALGKGPELRALLLEVGKRREAQGLRSSILVQVAGPESGLFTVLFPLESLADFEARRVRLAADPVQAEYNRKRDALSSRPLAIAIREILVPFPAR